MKLTLDIPLHFAEELPVFNIVQNVASDLVLPRIVGPDSLTLKTVELKLDGIPQSISDQISYYSIEYENQIDDEHCIEYSGKASDLEITAGQNYTIHMVLISTKNEEYEYELNLIVSSC